MIRRVHIAALLLTTLAGCMGTKRPINTTSRAVMLAGDYVFEPAGQRTSGMRGMVHVDSGGTFTLAVQQPASRNSAPVQRDCEAQLQVVDDIVDLACPSAGIRLTIKDGEFAPEAVVWLERTVKKTRTSVDRQICQVDGFGSGSDCSAVVAPKEVVERQDVATSRVSLRRE